MGRQKNQASTLKALLGHFPEPLGGLGGGQGDVDDLGVVEKLGPESLRHRLTR